MIREAYGSLVERIRDEVNRYYGERLVTLAIFGSVARQTMRPDSDVDIFICAEPLPRGRRRRMLEFESVEQNLEMDLVRLRGKGIMPELSPIMKTKAETEQGSLLFLDMIEHVMILVDRDDFFKDYLLRLQSKLKAMGSKKVRVGSYWYWDLISDPSRVKEIHF